MNSTSLIGSSVHESDYRATIDDHEHLLAMDAGTAEELERILSPETGPFQEWGERGAICVIAPSSGANRTTYLVRDVIQPSADDLRLEETTFGHELIFEPVYKRRARREALDKRGTAGLLYVHSHPERAEGKFSPGDLEHDTAQLYQEAKRLEDPDAPLLVAVTHDGDDPWQVWRYTYRRARTKAQRRSDKFGPESVQRIAITAIRVVGETLEKRPTADGERVRGPPSHHGRLSEELQDSTIRLWGRSGQRLFAGLRVGIVGCGGGGSILAETLARLGVGELVLIDFDRVEPGNANRHLGATPADIENRRDKVEVCKRIAETAATAPDFEARAVVGSVFENQWGDYDALEDLLDCDVVMNAADPDTARAVVSRLSYAHIIPAIDAGSTLPSENGELTWKARATVAVSGPGHPCLKCSGQWSDGGFENHRTPEGYEEQGYYDDEEQQANDDEEVRQPSSMPTNLIAMGLASQRFIGLIQGITPDLNVGKLNFRLASWGTDWKELGDNRLQECLDSCRRPETGIGDGADLKRGEDFHLREERRSASTDTENIG
ncbi:ThiF family adenylyltransferase [Halanaeroarchaeum sp. HSR-CO]|uniref:HesA/MoeB/ThiF family protein n=1 Tax=Halanaeroarchaeum sp. HSR-CO TaxID=2866382 RepID=UPI00217D00F6|nr:ThiF family adenylyltransferase [Halanaeroarchaeum sp. HSR-CO]